MRKIERTGQFKRDYKRELKGRHRSTLETTFVDVLKRLINNQTLPEKHRDHALTGDWLDDYQTRLISLGQAFAEGGGSGNVGVRASPQPTEIHKKKRGHIPDHLL